MVSNLVPRVSHLNAWGERGETLVGSGHVSSLAPGVKMRDPGNEVGWSVDSTSPEIKHIDVLTNHYAWFTKEIFYVK